MSTPSWMILIPTIPKRHHQFTALVRGLLDQGGAVMAWLNEGEMPLGQVRDGMIAHAHELGTDYVSFVDDDDRVSADYVSSILAALAEQPDHVGFALDFRRNGEPVYAGGVQHRLAYGQWGYNPATRVLYRDFTHLDPIRTEHARRGSFAKARRYFAEDRVWVDQVRPHLRTDVYIDRVLYHYNWRPAQSSWDGKGRQLGQMSAPRFITRSPHFLWHPESL